MKKREGVLSAGIGFLFVQGIEQMYNIRSDGTLFSNSVTSALLFGMAVYVSYKILQKTANRRTWVFAIMGGVLYSGMVSFGHAFNCRDTMWLRESFLAWIFIAPFVALIWKVVLHYVDTPKLKIKQIELSFRYFLLYWGVLFVVWIPALLASYPGIYAYDTGNQLNVYMEGSISAAHPVLHTLFLGAAMDIGVGVFHSSQIGALIYTLAQMFLLSAMFAWIVYQLRKYGIPAGFCYLALAFYGLHPANGLMAMSATKNVLFAGFVGLLVLQLVDLTIDSETFFGSWKKLLLLAVNIMCSLALCNDGILMLALFAPFFFLIFKKYWKKAILVLGGCLFLHLCITGPVYSALNIPSGDPRELFSILMQTSARAYNLVYLDLTEEEKEGFYSVISDEGLKSYLPRFADPVKAYFNGKEFVKNPQPFMNSWISVGRRYTKLYMDAFLSHNLGYWYPGEWIPNNSGLRYAEYKANGNGAEYKVEMDPKSESLWKLYNAIANKAEYQNIPVVSILLPIGTFMWILWAGGLIIWYQRKYWALTPLLPLLLYTFTLFLGPVVLLRYAYPVIVCLPMILYLIFVGREN